MKNFFANHRAAGLPQGIDIMRIYGTVIISEQGAGLPGLRASFCIVAVRLYDLSRMAQ